MSPVQIGPRLPAADESVQPAEAAGQPEGQKHGQIEHALHEVEAGVDPGVLLRAAVGLGVVDVGELRRQLGLERPQVEQAGGPVDRLDDEQPDERGDEVAVDHGRADGRLLRLVEQRGPVLDALELGRDERARPALR